MDTTLAWSLELAGCKSDAVTRVAHVDDFLFEF